MLGTWEMIAIVVAILFLVLWLGKKSPDMARTAGKSIAEFKAGIKELPDALEDVKKEINR